MSPVGEMDFRAPRVAPALLALAAAGGGLRDVSPDATVIVMSEGGVQASSALLLLAAMERSVPSDAGLGSGTAVASTSTAARITSPVGPPLPIFNQAF